jgi:hypothetical protein
MEDRGKMKKPVLLILSAAIASTVIAQPGNKSDQEFKSIANSVKGKIFAQYNKALKSNRGLRGKIVFDISIDESGAMNSCSVYRSQLNHSGLEKNICSILSSKSYKSLPTLPYKTQHELTFDYF